MSLFYLNARFQFSQSSLLHVEIETFNRRSSILSNFEHPLKHDEDDCVLAEVGRLRVDYSEK